MVKKLLVCFAILLQLSAAAVALRYLLPRTGSDSIYIDGKGYSRDSTVLDLSGGPVGQWERLMELPQLQYLNLRNTGLTPEEYDAICAALPDCEITWSPYFQGQYYPDTTTTLTVERLSDEDLDILEYFPHLSVIDASGCRDYPQITALCSRFPNCSIFYNIFLSGEHWAPDATNLVLPDADVAAVRSQLPYLPDARQILFTGTLPTMSEIEELQQEFPDITFLWQVNVCGKTVDGAATELDVSGVPMTDSSAVEAALPYLPNLQKVVMCDCGLSNEAMDTLNRRYEDILFVWSVDIGPYLRIRTDTTAFIPVKNNVWVNDADCYNLRYCTEMVCLDLGHMDLTQCDFVAYMPKLKYLILADTHITDLTPLTDLKELIFLELFLTWVRDYTPLTTCTALEDLNLGYTFGDPDVIRTMTWLKRLWWSGGGGARAGLAASMPDTQVHLSAGSSTGEGWRKGQNYYDMRDMLGMGYMSH